jgi:hypothetical protein
LVPVELLILKAEEMSRPRVFLSIAIFKAATSRAVTDAQQS